jgi:hypothetical protein
MFFLELVSSTTGYLLFQSRLFIALFYGKHTRDERQKYRGLMHAETHMKQCDYLPFIFLVGLPFLYINKQRDSHGVWPASYDNPKKPTTEVS